MAYRLNITEHADEMIDNLINYLLYRLKNKQAASHLLTELDGIYDRLEQNPVQFPLCLETYLANKGYRNAVVPQMNYVVIFSVDGDFVNIVGIFHQTEDYFKGI